MIKRLVALLAILGVLPQPLYASYPGTLWSSERLPESVLAVRVGHFSPGETHLATLSPHKLTIYHKGADGIDSWLEYHDAADLFKLSLIDINDDGLDELVVSSSVRGRLEGFILKVADGKLTRIFSRLGYLAAIAFDGGKKLVAQRALGSDDFTGPLIPLTLEGGVFREGSPLKLPGGLSGDNPSLFSVAGLTLAPKSYWLVSRPSGEITLYDRSDLRAIWSSSERYGGPVHEVPREVREILAQSRGRQLSIPLTPQLARLPDPVLPPLDPYAPPPPPSSPESSLRIFLVKNSGYLKEVVGAHPSIKSSRLVSLLWTGYGWQEKWSSPSFDGALSDFDLIDWNGDGRLEIVSALWLRDKGFVDTLKKQDSLLIVIEPQNP